ncbi:MAG: S41 family peptidase [Opitutaceae bacterium]
MPTMPDSMQRFLSPARTLICLASLALLAGCATAPTAYREPQALVGSERVTHNIAVFDRVWTLVNQKYFDAQFRGVDWAAQRVRYRPEAAAALDETALYRTLNQLCGELQESHLRAFTPRQVHDGRFSRQTDFGMKLLWLDGRTAVFEVDSGGPAAAAGIRRGWLVVARDGVPLVNEPLARPKPDTPETWQFHDEQDQLHSLVLTPRLSRHENLRLESRALAGGIHYLRFDSFNPVWPLWLSRELKAHRSAPGVIVDLRQNHGGHIRTLFSFLGQFFAQSIDAGSSVKRDGKPAEKQGRSMFSSYDGPLAILTSQATASAAEIFAHVAQYHKRATVVGRRTAGAVLGSFNYRLPDGGYLTIPELDYLGVDGQRLEGRGVTPDIAVSPPDLGDLRANRDRDLEAALQLFSPR